MELERSWEKITKTGKILRRNWQELQIVILVIRHNGLASLAGFTFESSRALEYKTLITQEMLKKGYLAATNAIHQW